MICKRPALVPGSACQSAVRQQKTVAKFRYSRLEGQQLTDVLPRPPWPLEYTRSAFSSTIGCAREACTQAQSEIRKQPATRAYRPTPASVKAQAMLGSAWSTTIMIASTIHNLRGECPPSWPRAPGSAGSPPPGAPPPGCTEPRQMRLQQQRHRNRDCNITSPALQIALHLAH